MNHGSLVRRPSSESSSTGFLVRTHSLELYGVVAVAAVTAFAIWKIIGNGVLVGQDAATQFYPWYSYLGEQLRDLSLPYWNPAQFSGAPFMADPQSGWTYLPAMAIFAILPLAMAVPAFLAFHLALAGFGTYVFSRALGIGPVGAAMAAMAYELSGPVYSRSVCCTAQLQVISWIPILLLGAEMALRRDQWLDRLRWIALAAVALSQIYASWLGQGSYYAVLLVSGYVVYRAAFPPRGQIFGLRAKARNAVSVLIPIGLLSLGLGAAGIVPRLEYNSLSNLAGGEYGGESAYAAVTGGWDAGKTAFSQMHTDPYYMGGVVIALATIAVILTKGQFATPFFTGTLVLTFILSSATETPVHTFVYGVLPKFESLHRHWPERMSLVSYIAFAVLAGAAVDALPRWASNRKLALPAAVPVLIAAGFTIGLSRSDDRLPGVLLVCVAFVVVTLVIVGFARSQTTMKIAAAALILVSVLDLLSANAAIMGNGPYGGFHSVDIGRYYVAGPAARFLQYRSQDELFRVVGYDPQLVTYEDGTPIYYRYQFHSDRTRQLGVNNRATVFGLEDVQGYNPIQYQPYVDYMTALNGETQDYHDANVGISGIGSPLLDVLNARFIIVPSTVPLESESMFSSVFAAYPTVFDDGRFRVLERESALPRAWIVHSTIQASDSEAMELVGSGAVDPSTTVVVDRVLPSIEAATSIPDVVELTAQSPEQLVFQTTSASAGVLVVSEVDYPNWHAYVDGERVEIMKAFGLVRAVEIPSGTHEIEFRYEPDSERLGMGLTGLTVIMLGGIVLVGARRRQIGGQGG